MYRDAGETSCGLGAMGSHTLHPTCEGYLLEAVANDRAHQEPGHDGHERINDCSRIAN